MPFLREEEVWQREWHLPGDRMQKGRERIHGLFPGPQTSVCLIFKEIKWLGDTEVHKNIYTAVTCQFLLEFLYIFEKPSRFESLGWYLYLSSLNSF